MAIISAKGYGATRKSVYSKHSFFKNRRLIIIFAVITFSYLSLWTWNKVNDSQTLPIHAVKINGNLIHLNKIRLQETITPFLKNGLLNLDSEGLKRAVQNLPWVDSLNVSRHWPDKIIINLIEHIPVAQWNAQGLLDTNGVLFNPGQKLVAEIPFLYGPEGEQIKVWHAYSELNPLLESLGLKIDQLFLSASQAWRLKLNNGIEVVLGRIEVKHRLRRLIAVYSQMVGSHGSDIDYIDLRYSNGMVIKWKSNSQ